MKLVLSYHFFNITKHYRIAPSSFQFVRTSEIVLIPDYAPTAHILLSSGSETCCLLYHVVTGNLPKNKYHISCYNQESLYCNLSLLLVQNNTPYRLQGSSRIMEYIERYEMTPLNSISGVPSLSEC